MSLLISEEELKRRTEEADIIYHRIGKKGNVSNHENAGRNPGDKNVIPFIRELIAEEALNPLNNATCKEIATAYGVSESSVNNYKNGKHTNAEDKMEHPEIVNKADELIKSKKEKIVSGLTTKLMNAMESLNDQAIASEKPLVQSIILRNLASTIEKVEGKTKDDDEGMKGDTHYHVHVPAPINLTQFEVFEINEKPLK